MFGDPSARTPKTVLVVEDNAAEQMSIHELLGHALGAAGILEAVISLLALEQGFMPGTLNTRELDEHCGPQIRLENGEGPVRNVMSNSFGFGGSNCVLLFGGARQ